MIALFGVVEESFLLETLDDVLTETLAVVLIAGADDLTVVFCTFAVVFAGAFAVVFTTGLGAGLAEDLATRTTGNCNASFISCEACDIQSQAAVSSSGVIPWTADDCF